MVRGLLLGVIALCLLVGAVLWNRRASEPAAAPHAGVTAPSGPTPRLPTGVIPGTPPTVNNGVMVRYLRARSIQKSFQEHAYDIRCDAVEAKHMLVVAGPSIDREFASQFMSTPPLLKSIRQVGFNVVGFWRGPYLTGTHLQDFPLEASATPEK